MKTRPQLSLFDIFAFFANFILTYLLITSVFEYEYSYKTTLIYLGIFTLATVFIFSKQKLFRKEAILPGVFAILTSLSFMLHSNLDINLVSFFLLIYLSGSYCIKMTGSGRHPYGSYFYILDVIKCEVLLPIKNIFLPLLSLGTLRKNRAPEKKKVSKKALSLVFGMLLGVPVLLVVIPLLLSGDAAFENLIGTAAESFSNWFSNLFRNFNTSYRILFWFPTAIVAPYIYSVMFSFRHGVTNEQNKDTSPNYKKLRFASSDLIGGFLGIISLVYVVFLFSQLSYFFSAFGGKLPGGTEFTVAEYARRGFFEMTKIAGINFAVIAVSVLFAKRKENAKLSEVVKWIDLFLCVFTIILISTSISKIVLYISAFGLTHKRIYVFVFDVVLIFVFLSVIIRLFKEKFPYMKVIISASCLAILVLGFLNVDGMIAKNNVSLYLSGKTNEIFVYDIYELCPGGIESLDKLAVCDDKSVSADAQRHIADIVGGQYNPKSFMGLSLTLDGYKAKKYIEKNMERLTEYKNQYYSNPNEIYLFLNTKTKIKSIKITDGLCRFKGERRNDYSNFDLILFKEEWRNYIDDETKEIFDKENDITCDVDKMIIIEDENGVIHNIFLHYVKEYADEGGFYYMHAGVIEIAEDENGFFAKRVVNGEATYNFALEAMKEQQANMS